MTVIVTVCILALQGICSRAEERPISHDPRHFDGGSLGGTLDISDNWLVHGGDDPSFASPQLDDSAWQVATQGKPLSAYGIHDQPIVWYRLHVQVPASETDLSLVLARFKGSFEAFVNGISVGQRGRMSGGGVWDYNSFDCIMAVPKEALNHGSLLVAIRGAVGGPSRGEQRPGGISYAGLGRAENVQQAASLQFFHDLTLVGCNFLLQSVTLLVLVALVIALRDRQEYLVLAIAFALESFTTLFQNVVMPFLHLSIFWAAAQNAVLPVLRMLALIEFLHLILKRTKTGWIRAVQASLIAYSLANLVIVVLTFRLDVRLPPNAYLYLGVLNLLTWSPFILVLPGLLLWAWKRRDSYDAGLLLLPIGLMSLWMGVFATSSLLARAHLAPPIPDISFLALGLDWDELVDITSNLMLLVYIIFRVVRTVRTGAYYAAEVEAAHTVQQVLLSRSSQETPGFKVETVYLPASEVGGDFFLVAPGDDGALVALVGDVAGKGMLAAMRVSVILGALRREEGRQPSQILEGLNDAMMRQGDMGMTTACCIRIEPGGRFTVANAGHISPYIDGTEFLTDGALPLGILLGSKYGQTEGSLPAGKNFVLMSDGVVEARSEKLGLYGFERLAPLTTMPAREIAETAKAFGQEDDITVVTVSWIA